MDWLDWIVRIAGGAFGLLTILFGFSRITGFADRDTNPIWWLSFIVIGGVWAVSLIADWAAPVGTTIYLANGGNAPREAHFDERVICIPPHSYEGYGWRLGAPRAVEIPADRTEPRQHYDVGKGTWFINLSSVQVSADFYDRAADSISFDALFSLSSGATRVNARFGRPYRLFSQSAFDRMFSPDGNVTRQSVDGPCGSETAQR